MRARNRAHKSNAHAHARARLPDACGLLRLIAAYCGLLRQVPTRDFLTPAAFIFLYENQVAYCGNCGLLLRFIAACCGLLRPRRGGAIVDRLATASRRPRVPGSVLYPCLGNAYCGLLRLIAA